MTFQLHPDLKRDGIVLGAFPLCQILLINDSAWPWFVLVPQRADIVETTDLNPAKITNSCGRNPVGCRWRF